MSQVMNKVKARYDVSILNFNQLNNLNVYSCRTNKRD